MVTAVPNPNEMASVQEYLQGVALSRTGRPCVVLGLGWWRGIKQLFGCFSCLRQVVLSQPHVCGDHVASSSLTMRQNSDFACFSFQGSWPHFGSLYHLRSVS